MPDPSTPPGNGVVVDCGLVTGISDTSIPEPSSPIVLDNSVTADTEGAFSEDESIG